MKIANDKSGNTDRVGRVVTALQGNLARVQRHGGGENLESRPHFVDAQRCTVETRFVIHTVELVGVEIGKRDHRQDLAIIHIHDDAGGTDRGERRH